MDHLQTLKTDILKPVFLDRFDNIKHKLKGILVQKRYCTICIEYYDDMLTIDVEFELATLHQKITIKDVIENIFNDDSILTSNYICNNCMDQILQSYIFIATTKFTAEVLGIYVTGLSEKVNACDLETVEHLESSHIAMILDGSEVEKFFPERLKIEESKRVETKEKKSYKCPQCSDIIIDYKEYLKHKKTHTKSEYECTICGKVFKNDESLSVHYTIHKVTKCKLCFEIIAEKDLSDHLKAEHKDSALECHFCNIAFYNKRALETHVNVSHKKNLNEQCPMCLKHLESNDVDSHKCRYTCPQCKVVRCRHFEYLLSYRDQRLKGKRVKCLHCDYVTNKRETFLGHINRVHLKYHPFACKHCTMKFNSKINLHAHIHRVHKEKYICGYCDEHFNEKNELEVHIEYCQFIKRDYACKKCLASFSTYKEIVSHTKFRHNGLYQCQICNKEFLYKSRLKYHLQKIHSEQNNDEEGIDSQLKKRKTEQLCICETCGKSFSSTDALNSHLKIHEDKVPCPECQKMFYPRKLNVHRKQHLAEKDPILKEKLKKRAKVKCSQCDYVTYGNISLEGHVNRHHKKIKPYACSVCNKEFMGQLHLRRHMQCHTGEKSRKCELCPKVLANKDCFRMHMRRHTGEKPYTCDICGDRFRSSSIMNVHKNRMHAEKSSECPLCGSMFYSVGELRNHCKKVHWKQKDKKFNYKELEGLKEEHYYLFYDGRTPMMKDESKK